MCARNGWKSEAAADDAAIVLFAAAARERLGRGDAPGAARLLACLDAHARRLRARRDALAALAWVSHAPVALAPLDPSAMAAEAAHALASAAQVSVPVLPSVVADAALLRVAFTGLLQAVVDAAGPRGAPCPRLAVDASRSGEAVLIRLCAEGGAPQAVARLREVLASWCSGQAADEPGLRLARAAIERQGGLLWAESHGPRPGMRVLLRSAPVRSPDGTAG